MKIGLLSTLNHPLLPHYITSLYNAGFNELTVICDLKSLSLKDLAIIEERTQGQFKTIENQPAFEFASQKSGAAFYFVDNHNSIDCLKRVKALKLDCLINAGTPRKLNTPLLESCPQGVINVHPGRLPKYRGCSSVEWTLYNDEDVTNTVHRMNEEYDAGPILTIETYDKHQFDSYQGLRCSLYQAAFDLLPKALNGLLTGEYKFTKQNDEHACTWKPIDEQKFKEVQNSFSITRQGKVCN